ncbi:unnamed protein product [Pleuronectes platessa]|uniref:Uncharacterized protein n=1 Tax=Pleuronectes platessa TaxID=8262 RepID=A0A9N7ZCA6_PLEPL|nr:unnamed protein product [Pleuronectes platessa]
MQSSLAAPSGHVTAPQDNIAGKHCAAAAICSLLIASVDMSGLDGRMNRPQVLQLANGILPTQGGLWRREAKTEAPLLAKLYHGMSPPCLQTLICTTPSYSSRPPPSPPSRPTPCTLLSSSFFG